MKNKKISLLIGVLVVALILVGVWLFLKQNKKFKDSYIIREWNNFEQNIEILIDDKTVIEAVKTSESDNDDGAKTGGEYTVIAIKGLKSGSTTATVIITNSDDTIESNITYYFEVNKDLKVKLVKTQYGKSK